MLFLLGSCAKVVTPVGGPKDTEPPKAVKEHPVNKCLNFKNSAIKITFDEFFTLNKPSENILISPPLSVQPDYQIREKSLVIRFRDSLLPNTTYNIVFSNSILDYHEGNALTYYHYSFSTGSAIDSARLSGKVLDAQTHAGDDGFFVLLYDRDIDSLPLTSRPSYITKCGADGSFVFQNIKDGQYKVFALKDINANLRYDLPDETIAFADRPVLARSADTTSESVTDTTLVLYAFCAADSVPVLMRHENPAAGIYKFPYKSAVTKFTATPLGTPHDYFQTLNRTADTVTWYFKTMPSDTMVYLLDADGVKDTVTLTPYQPKKTAARGDRQDHRKLAVSFQNEGHAFKPLTLSFPYPVMPTDSFRIFVSTQQKGVRDTVCWRTAVPDGFVMQLALPITFETKKSYSVMIPDSVFFGYNGLSNDTLRCSFTTKSEKDYGTLSMNYRLPAGGSAYIAQLWRGSQLVQEDVLEQDTTMNYGALSPDNYKVTVVEDANRNGRWDAGDYRKSRQAERVFVFGKAINIRAYWEEEETFRVGEDTENTEDKDNR